MFASNSSQVSSAATYIEDVFSTYLWTGDNSTNRAITNGIDLSTYGGMVWIKNRNDVVYHNLWDTARGVNNYLNSNTTGTQGSASDGLKSFDTTGFTVGNNNYTNVGGVGYTYVGWTFRKQAKFFDVVTYTGNGANRTIAHNLGSAPGFMIVKRTDTTANWQVYHRSLANTEYLVLNTTAVKATGTTRWNSTTPTSTEFSLGTDATVNANGGTYVAYLFAHDAGGFGTAGTDNVISCGSFTTDASNNATVTLGYEPQFIIYKRSDSTGNWFMQDVMRGLTTANTTQTGAILLAESAATESAVGRVYANATGFSTTNSALNANATYIYIAIRRGPMKTPTSGTSVFSPNAENNTGNMTITTNFPVDMAMFAQRGTRSGNANTYVFDKLRSNGSTNGNYLITNSTLQELNSASYGVNFQSNTSYLDAFFNSQSGGGSTIYWAFRRAPSFFDEVCYTGTGSNTTQTHNLGVVPELMIVKRRDTTGAWDTYSAALANTEYLVLNTTDAKATGATRWNSTTPTSSVFSLGTSTTVNASGGTYVAYLFASCPGVSKVGSYTGSGTTKQIDCGFTGGARFVLIKRTDSTGDWYVWDTARGIVSGNDPYLLLNSTAAEVTNTDYIDAYSAGFEISSTAPAAINASGGTFVFFAIS